MAALALATLPSWQPAAAAGADTPLPSADAVSPAYDGPVDPDVPRPVDVLGFRPGADYRLADWATILEYLRNLDRASDRLTLESIGTSTDGRPLVMALVSSPENLVRAERLREIARRLARARDVDAAEAARLAAEGKAVVWIDAGIHSNEVAPPQAAPELAYILAAGESHELRRIRRDVVLLLMPNLNPDGHDMVVEWYRKNLGTPWETAPLPRLYHRYVGHDNNRDWYMTTQMESRAVAEVLYRRWYPQIVVNHHQSAPFPARIFVPPFADPVNPEIPALVLRGIERVGNAITSRLDAEGKVGAISGYRFTTWWNGGMRTVPYFHNMVGILTETALFRYATPRFYRPGELPDRFRNGWSTRRASTDYPSPWPGGWWRLRDAVDYVNTSSLAVLDVASRYREDWLRNIHRMGRASISRGESGHPAGWAIPPGQRDPGAAAELVNVLLRNGVEVRRATGTVTGDGRELPRGSFWIPAAQAFRPFVADLLQAQRYPDRRRDPEDPPRPPYDVAGWTLPFQMGVEVRRLERPVEGSFEPVTEEVSPEGRIDGSGSVFVFGPRPNATATAANRLLAAGEAVYRTDREIRIRGREIAPGAMVAPAGPGVRGTVTRIVDDTGLEVLTVDRVPDIDGWELRRPRIGIYEPWVANMDAGWTRWLLDRHEFEYRVLRDADVRGGDLRERFDAIVLPSASVETLVAGHAPGTMPPAYTGGLGDPGVEALREFVDAGGTLICLDRSSRLAIRRLGVPVVDALDGLDETEFSSPGSLLRIDVDPRHPLAYGMPARATAFFVRSRGFDLEETAGGAGTGSSGSREGRSAERPPSRRGDERPRSVPRSVASYAARDLLESGWLHGGEHLAGRSAVVQVPRGRGQIVMIGFRAQFRGQPHETFKLLFNALFQAAAEPASLR